MNNTLMNNSFVTKGISDSVYSVVIVITWKWYILRKMFIFNTALLNLTKYTVKCKDMDHS